MEELTLLLSSKRFKLSLFIFLTLSLGLVILGTAESYSYSYPAKKQSTLHVVSGDSVNSIFSRFSLNITEKTLLKIFLLKNKVNLIQAGHYDISSMPWREILIDLHKGNIQQFQFQIKEGANFFDLKNQIIASNLSLDCPEFDCLDNQFGFFEGTLMPDTYFYNYQSSASAILVKSQNLLIQYAENLWANKSSLNPLKRIEDALILASIVEKEAGNDDEKISIAGVFLHRLNLKMRLQADPTIIYGLLPEFNGNITKKNLKDSSNPYNTYQIKGLPPTPISIISKSSLEAVILGEPNEYLFFVAKGDGTHYFSSEYSEHLKAVKKYQLNK